MKLASCLHADQKSMKQCKSKSNKAKRSAKQQRAGAYLFLFAGIAEKRYSEMVIREKSSSSSSYIGELLTAAARCKKPLVINLILDVVVCIEE